MCFGGSICCQELALPKRSFAEFCFLDFGCPAACPFPEGSVRQRPGFTLENNSTAALCSSCPLGGAAITRQPDKASHQLSPRALPNPIVTRKLVQDNVHPGHVLVRKQSA